MEKVNIGKNLKIGTRIHRNEWIWGKTWIIVTDSGEGLIKISQDPEDGVILSGLSVLPDYRGKGIGKKLIQEAEKIIKEEIGNVDICLSVESRYPELVEWYKKLGYVIIYDDYKYTEMMKCAS